MRQSLTLNIALTNALCKNSVNFCFIVCTCSQVKGLVDWCQWYCALMNSTEICYVSKQLTVLSNDVTSCIFTHHFIYNMTVATQENLFQ